MKKSLTVTEFARMGGGELILIPAQRGRQTVYVVLFGSSRTCWKLCPMFWKMALMAVAEG